MRTNSSASEASGQPGPNGNPPSWPPDPPPAGTFLAAREGEAGFPRLARINLDAPGFVEEVLPPWASAPAPAPASAPAPSPTARQTASPVRVPSAIIPREFLDEISAGWMPRSASSVLDVMLRAAFAARALGLGNGQSAWATNGFVAQGTGLSPRQVSNIRRAIIARGWLRKELVGPIDPIDPRNRSGERWVFTWMTGERPARDPAEAPPVRPRRGRPPGSRRGGGNEFLPPREPGGGGGNELPRGVEMHFHQRY